jgi:predicted DCC family thiol-disulfide oxidoreductase YuxK
MLRQYKLAKGFFLKSYDFCFYRNNENNRQDDAADIFSVSVVLYDYACPVCRVEMERLKRRDRHERLVLLDINSPAFNEQTWGVTHAQASAALHVLTPDNEWLVGVPAIHHVYQQVGLGWLMAPTRWPVVASIADRFYRYIAPNRYAISRWLGLASTSVPCTDSVCTSAKHKQGEQS